MASIEATNSLMAAMNGLQLTTLANQLRQLQEFQNSFGALEMMTQTSRQREERGGTGGAVLASLGGFLGGGFGLASLISGIADLFGGDEAPSLPALVRYSRPASIRAEAGISGDSNGQVFAVDSAQGGLPRAMTALASPQITVQVQTLDSRSFLDHSQEIAMAVRQAMLETSVLRDVIREV